MQLKKLKLLKKMRKFYNLFITSWAIQTKEFFENSTLHGVRYIAEVKRPFFERFMWFICVTIGAIATIVIILNLWEKFQTNPTITGLDTDFHNWDVPFPAIIACQKTPANLTKIQQFIETNLTQVHEDEAEELLIALTKFSFDNLKDFVKLNEEKILPIHMNLKDIAFKLMNSCEDIFTNCKWKSITFNCCKRFAPVFTESGICFAFNSRHYERKTPWTDEIFPEFNLSYIKETDLSWSLKFSVKDTTIPMSIYIINSDDQAGVDVKPQHIWDYKVNKIFFSVQQTYTTDDTRQLSIKQRHCIFSDEIKLTIDNIYSFTACTRQCRMDNSMKICNCIPFFYPEIGIYKHCNVKQLNCVALHLDYILSVDHCACELGCFNTVYEVEKLNEGATSIVDEMETSFVSWPMVRYKREVLFGWVDLLVSFGGIAGLFLGFSLLSGIEIIYYFTIRSFFMIIKEENKLIQIQHEKKNKSSYMYDLSLVPYFIKKPEPGSGLKLIYKICMKKPQFNSKITQQNNKILPLQQGKIYKRVDYILPPFGIEFIN